MKEVVVISGKGGTGKTSVAGAFAAIAGSVVVADCDVDAADLHLILGPVVEYEEEFSGGKVAWIDSARCIGCGRCADMCRFGAISFRGPGNDVVAKTFVVDAVSCEGCKVCVEFCSVKAVEFERAVNGRWFRSVTRFGPMVHARLGIAEENSGKLVTLIRGKAREIAEEKGLDYVIVDGSPGIGCPVIASITGADAVVAVTEPTLSGIHDLRRVSELAGRFGVRTLVCVNKADINLEMTGRIFEFAGEKGLKVVGRLPYDDCFTRAQMRKETVVEYGGEAAERVKAMWGEVVCELG